MSILLNFHSPSDRFGQNVKWKAASKLIFLTHLKDKMSLQKEELYSEKLAPFVQCHAASSLTSMYSAYATPMENFSEAG